jgi:hypothetical protein
MRVVTAEDQKQRYDCVFLNGSNWEALWFL